MDLKVNKDPVRSGEKICSCIQEQSVELDYVLPDYYPEIFRIIKCFAEPQITACAVSGSKVSYELTVRLRVIYCSEESGRPEAVEQKLVYSRTVDTDRIAENARVYINAVPDRINCRAVNRRRIDVRGAVTVNICVIGENETEIISEAFGGNIQLRKKSCTCPAQIIKAQKRVTVSDDFTLSETAPPVGTILRSAAEIISSDKKLIAGKAAAKGELKISVVYTSPEEDTSPVTSIQFSLPFSQLVELEGLDDDFTCMINSSVISCDLRPASEGDGHSRQLECEVLLLIDCTAVKMAAYEIACDEYSTTFASAHTGVPVKIEKEPVPIDSSFSVRGICENKDSPLSSVYDAWCSASTLKPGIDASGSLTVSGSVTVTVMGQTESGDFVICEADIPVEEKLSTASQEISQEADIRASFSVISCSYTITADNTAEVKAEIAVRGWFTDHIAMEAITEITLDESAAREQSGDYALRLYFAESGEELWNVAKRYGASMLRIIEENELDGDVVKESKMLLIPAI